jgi:hypothetical protein
MSEGWLNRVALLGLVGVVLGALGANTVVDLDMFHEMALFRQSLAIGRIPLEDTFSYVPTVKPLIHYEWGTGALLYLVTVSCGLGASGRYLSVFYVAWICCVPAYVGKTKIGEVLRDLWIKRKGLLSAYWMACGALGLLAATQQQFWHLKIPTAAAGQEQRAGLIYPVGGVDYLAGHGFKGNLMVPFSAGSYVSWKLYPDVKVSVDSRFEVAYPVDWAMEQVRFYQGKDGWKETLNRYPTDAVLVPRLSPIDNLLDQATTTATEPNAIEWRRVYMDDGYSIFVRSHVGDRFVFVDNTGKQIVGRFP